MESLFLSQVARDVLMAVQAQLRLAVTVAAVMAQRALLLVLLVRGAELAGHEQRLGIHGFGPFNEPEAQKNSQNQ
jgi:hypothetical protein